jgi:hypothetical protein
MKPACTCALATVVSISLAGLAAAQLTAESPSKLCSVSGRVRNKLTGEPVKRAKILLEDQDSRRWPYPLVTTSDSEGAFHLARIEPGRYTLSVERDGFLNAAYGEKGIDRPGAILTLEPGQELKELEIPITPFGVIAGRVTNSDGESTINGEIQAWQHSVRRGRWDWRVVANTKTNDLGEYRLTDLKPGVYVIGAVGPHQYESIDRSARPLPSEADVPTLYPAATEFDSAQTVRLGPGVHVGGIDIAMVHTRTLRVHGHVACQGDEPPATEVLVLLESRIGHLSFARQFSSNTRNWNGDFDLAGIPAGSYTLVARDLEQPDRMAVLPVDVSADIEGLAVIMSTRGGGHVSGKIRLADPRQIDLSRMSVSLAKNDGVHQTAEVESTGSFSIKNLQPGEYYVGVTGLPDTFYIKSVQFAGSNVRDTGLQVVAGDTGPLEIVLISGAGSVDGLVLDEAQQRVIGALTVLVPLDRRRIQTLVQTITTDQNGRYRFNNVEPGEYQLFAWQDAEHSPYLAPEFLAAQGSKGKTAVVGENARLTVPLRLIASKD